MMTAVAMLTQVRVALDHTTAITTCHVDNVEDLGLILSEVLLSH